jgi:hypothetical protein
VYEANSPVTVVERDLGALDEETAVVREGVLVELDVTALGVRDEDTVL